jgi:hypothetical protein
MFFTIPEPHPPDTTFRRPLVVIEDMPFVYGRKLYMGDPAPVDLFRSEFFAGMGINNTQVRAKPQSLNPLIDPVIVSVTYFESFGIYSGHT